MGFAGEHALRDFRKSILKMARNEHTSINVWMEMPIPELIEWVRAAIELNEEEKGAGENGS
jgi:hypothetical protein